MQTVGTHMIPEEACTRPTIVSVQPELGPKRAVKDVRGFRLHASNMDGIKTRMIKVSVTILLQDKFAILDLNILSVILHVEPNVRIVRVLLEIVDQPLVHQRLSFAIGFVQQVSNVWILREVLEDPMSVDTT